MLGIGEPKLYPVRPHLRSWVDLLYATICTKRLRSILEQFPAPRNRLSHPKNMLLAEQMLMQEFQNAGWSALRCPYVTDDFQLPAKAAYIYAGSVQKPKQQLAGANILAIKEGVASRDAIVVGAHYDTVPTSPGANDNTASVSALIELARILARYHFRKTIVLAAFDMEEIGLWGSKAFIRDFTRTLPVCAAIIYETMAYTSSEPGTQKILPNLQYLYPLQIRKIERRQRMGDWTMILHRQNSATIAKLVADGLAAFSTPDTPMLWRDPLDLFLLGRAIKKLVPAVYHFSRSDHRSFWEAGIAAIMLTDTANFRYPHYHEPTDTAEKLDYERLRCIVSATAYTLAVRAGLIVH